ncbi:MAG: type II toxin-antitoxin system CcdA family antitoxin [Hyphomonadaceae bacterium]
MGAERVKIELDAELIGRLRAAGVDPQAYLERLLRRKILESETPESQKARWNDWRVENQAELESYDAFIIEHGLWSEGNSVV